MDPVFPPLPLNVRHLAGGILQTIALAVVHDGDVNTSYTTRAVGTILVAILLAMGTIIAAAPPLRLFALLVPIVRADLIFLVLARLVRSLIWARRLTPTKLLYINEVFPLQAAAMIWNDCRPVVPHTPSEDERSVFVDWLSTQRDLWRPTAFDGVIARLLKFPFYLLLSFLAVVASATESAIFLAWQVVFNRGARNRFPVAIEGDRPEVLGHTMLISDYHLTWTQRFTTLGGEFEQNREARRVALRALHMATLLAHGGHTRLHEHAAGGHAMSEYYAAVVDNGLVKALLSKADELRIFRALPNGNRTTRGQPLPRQVLWARVVVGALQGLRGGGRWRGPVCIALFRVAQDNVGAFGRGTSRTALQRHVYSVLRRWLVDWTMYAWWLVDVEDASVGDGDALFERLARILRANIVHNTASLPHAAGELAASTERADDVNAMLARLLGDNWELWLQQANTVTGVPLLDAMAASGEWKCVGRQLAVSDSVDSTFYSQAPLQDAAVATAEDPPGHQVRAVLADRAARTLISRVRDAWNALPDRLMDTPDAQQANDEY